MTYYFSKSTNGFYVDDVHEPHQIPNDAVEITDKQHMDLLEGQASGKQITSDEDGNPILIAQIVGNITPLTPTEKLAKLGLTPDDLKALLG